MTPAAMAQAIVLGQEPASDQGGAVGDIVTAGVATGWNTDRIATALRIHRSTLFRRLSHHGVTLRSLRESHESRDRRATDATVGAGISR